MCHLHCSLAQDVWWVMVPTSEWANQVVLLLGNMESTLQWVFDPSIRSMSTLDHVVHDRGLAVVPLPIPPRISSCTSSYSNAQSCQLPISHMSFNICRLGTCCPHKHTFGAKYKEGWREYLMYLRWRQSIIVGMQQWWIRRKQGRHSWPQLQSRRPMYRDERSCGNFPISIQP